MDNRNKIWQAWRNSFAKSRIFLFEVQRNFKQSLFEKNDFSKKMICTLRMTVSLHNPAENFLPNSQIFFDCGWKEIVEFQFYIWYSPKNVSLDLYEAILLTLPINVCQFRNKNCSDTEVNFDFFSKFKSFDKISLDRQSSILTILPVFFQPKIRRIFDDSREIFLKKKLKIDSFPQTFPLELQ